MHPPQVKKKAIEQLIKLTTTLYDQEGDKGELADAALILELDDLLQVMDHRLEECISEMIKLGIPIEE